MYLNVNLAARANGSNGAAESSSGTGQGGIPCDTPRTPEILNLLAGTRESSSTPGLGGLPCSTPRTPEILNLLSGGPFDNVAAFVAHRGDAGSAGLGGSNSCASYFQPSASGFTASTPGDGPSSPGEHASSSFSSFSSLGSSPATPSTPPGSGGGLSSIQNTRSYLIKEGLKLTIQSKRLATGGGSFDSDNQLSTPLKEEMGHLTTEDEERRRRRRERNKVAATKCRNRKKERTGILMQESDVLEDQNVNYRSEIQRLETEKRRLMDVLAMHSPNCMKTGGAGTPVSCSSDYIQHDPNSSQQGSHYGAMPSSSSNYPTYDCIRSSSESAAMGTNQQAHGHQHPPYMDVHSVPPESGGSFTSSSDVDLNSNIGPYSQINMVQQQHRMPYGTENVGSHPGPNYR